MQVWAFISMPQQLDRKLKKTTETELLEKKKKI